MDTQEGGFPPPTPAPTPPPIPPLIPDGSTDGPVRRTKTYTIAGVIVAVIVAGVVRVLIVSLSGGTPQRASATAPPDFGDGNLTSRADQAVNEARTATEPPPIPAGAESLFAKAAPAVVRIEVRDSQFRVIAHGSGLFVSADG